MDKIFEAIVNIIDPRLEWNKFNGHAYFKRITHTYTHAFHYNPMVRSFKRALLPTASCRRGKGNPTINQLNQLHSDFHYATIATTTTTTFISNAGAIIKTSISLETAKNFIGAISLIYKNNSMQA